MFDRQQQSIAYGTEPRQVLDLYPSPDRRHDTVVVFWYGGSWRSGSKQTYRFMGRALSSLGYTVVVPDYRLYPQAIFPAFIDDAAAAVKWVRDNLQPRRIILMGHSAGAHIASILVLEPHYLAAVGLSLADIAGFVGLSGPYDFTPHPDLRPVFGSAPASQWNPVDLVTSPQAVPLMLVHGRRDHIVKLSNLYTLQKAVTTAGGRVETQIYPWFGHFTILLPFITRFVIARSMKVRLQGFIDSL